MRPPTLALLWPPRAPHPEIRAEGLLRWCRGAPAEGGFQGGACPLPGPRAQSLSTRPPHHPQAPGPVTDHGLRDLPGQTQASLPEEVAQLAATRAHQEMGAASDALYMQMTTRSHP